MKQTNHQEDIRQRRKNDNMGGFYISAGELKKLEKTIAEGINELIGKDVILKMSTSYMSTNFNVFEKEKSVNKYGFAYRKHVACFCLAEMPGCCGYLISHYMAVYMDYRKKGISKFLQGVKFELANRWGYSYMVCTTTQDNEVQNHVLEKSSWKKTHQGKNRRTSNSLYLWIKEVPQERDIEKPQDK